MKSFIEQAQFYGAYHTNQITRYTHLVGVPLIVFSMMLFLGFVRIIVPGVFEINLAFFVTLAVLLYYFMLQWQLALVLTPVFCFLLWFADLFSQYGPTRFSLWVFLITFVSGWGLQIYGHYVEKKKPAFLDGVLQALIAPLYLVAELFFMAGYMTSLKVQIYGLSEEEVQKK